MARGANSGFFGRLFGSRKFTIPFSIFVAVVFWLVITLVQNPERTVTISGLPVSVVTEGTMVEELGLDVVGNTDSVVSVRITGPTYVVSGLSAADISVSANLSEVNAAGTYDIPLVASRVGTKTGYTVTGVTPETLTLTFDYINEAEFPVEAVANGASAVEGLIVDTPVVTNSEDASVTVRGPRSYIERIAAVRAVADVNATLSKTTSYDARIVLIDENGEEMDLSLFTLSSGTVKISVPIYKQKKVKIVPQFVNTPAGFASESIPYTIDEAEVSVKGTPETIDALSEVKTAPIDFYTLSAGNNTFTVALALPNGVKLAENINAVTVRVNLSGYRERTFTVTECRGINGGGLGISRFTPIRNVRVMGPSAVMGRLTAANLYAEVDLTGKAAGQYTITVTIKCATSDRVWQIGTYTTVVVLS